MRLSLFVAAAIAACSGSAASATTLTTYTDKTAFLAAGGASTDHESGEFNWTASKGFTNGLTVSTLGPTMITAGAFHAAERGIPTAILINDEEDLDFAFSSPRYGFGLNIFESTVDVGEATANNLAGAFGCGTPTCVDSVFTFTFKSAGAVVGTETFNAPDDTVAFFGVLSDTGFDRVEMRETTGSNDNERFGGVVSTAAVTPVPAPASALLLLGGFGGVMAVRRRKR